MTNLYHSYFLRKFLRFNDPDFWIGVNDIEEEDNFVNMLNKQLVIQIGIRVNQTIMTLGLKMAKMIV